MGAQREEIEMQFRTVKMQKGEGIRVLRDGRQVAILKPRQAKGGEIEHLCALIEGGAGND